MKHWKLIILALLVVVLSLVPMAVRSPYYIGLFILTGVNAILAMTFILMLKTGLISLAIAAFFGMGAYGSTLLVTKFGLSFWLALPLSAVVVGFIAFGIGYLFVRNAGFSFLILTAVMGMLFPVVMGNIPWVGGYHGIYLIPPPDTIKIPFLASIEFVSKTSYYYLMLLLLLIVILVFSAFYATWAGRAWTAIGLNPRLAESRGINIFKYRLLAFVIASVADAVAGSFYASYITSILPVSFTVFKTIYVHIYAILGGVEFAILGPLVGSAIMTFVPELLRIARELEPIITGALLILLMVFLPNGLMGLLTSKGRAGILNDRISRINNEIKLWIRSGRGRKGEGNAAS